ncbi:olfactory receptor 1f45-like [Lissotriton helveticus]
MGPGENPILICPLKPGSPKQRLEGTHSTVAEFILLGLSDQPEQQIILFMVFLFMYTVTFVGNFVIISVTNADSRLHKPMYFFLGVFSLVDISFSSVTVPKILINLLQERKSISFHGCFVQLFFFMWFGSMEVLFLAVMAYDRYMAVCHPLHYTMIMTKHVCLRLVACSWVVSLLNALLHTLMTSQLSFCGPNIIHHFFCDIPPLLELSCSDTFLNELVVFMEGGLVLLSPFFFIVLSYAQIISTILKIHSEEGRRRTFSTCSSHLAVVGLFYGTVLFMYFRPSSSFALDYDRAVSVVYTILTPMLNPFIYTLRNKEMKDALVKVLTSRHRITQFGQVTESDWAKHIVDTFSINLTKNQITTSTIGSDMPRAMNQERTTITSTIGSIIGQEDMDQSILKIIKKCKQVSAPGPNGIPQAIYKEDPKFWARKFNILFRSISNSGRVPESWRGAIINPIYKGGDRKNPTNYRLIALIDAEAKYYASLVLADLAQWSDMHSKIPLNQTGFRRGTGTMANAMALCLIGEKSLQNHQELYTCFVDFKAAFDRVNRNLLWAKLKHQGLPDSILMPIIDLYSNTWMQLFKVTY